MKDRQRNKKTFDRSVVYRYTDLIIMFIGISMIILSCLSLFLKIPKEYSVGATFGGLFFVLADTMIIQKTVGYKSIVFYFLALFFGVFSFFLLPVILLINSDAYAGLIEITDFATIGALGFVIMVMSYKAVNSRLELNSETSKELDELKEDFDKVLNEIEEIKNENTRLKMSLNNEETPGLPDDHI